MKIEKYETKFNFGDVVYLRDSIYLYQFETEEEIEEFLSDEAERFTIKTVCLEFSRNGIDETYTFIHRGVSVYFQETVEELMTADEIRECFKKRMRRCRTKSK